jgi:hypothetical protein
MKRALIDALRAEERAEEAVAAMLGEVEPHTPLDEIRGEIEEE